MEKFFGERRKGSPVLAFPAGRGRWRPQAPDEVGAFIETGCSPSAPTSPLPLHLRAKSRRCAAVALVMRACGRSRPAGRALNRRRVRLFERSDKRNHPGASRHPSVGGARREGAITVLFRTIAPAPVSGPPPRRRGAGGERALDDRAVLITRTHPRHACPSKVGDSREAAGVVTRRSRAPPPLS